MCVSSFWMSVVKTNCHPFLFIAAISHSILSSSGSFMMLSRFLLSSEICWHCIVCSWLHRHPLLREHCYILCFIPLLFISIFSSSSHYLWRKYCCNQVSVSVIGMSPDVGHFSLTRPWNMWCVFMFRFNLLSLVVWYLLIVTSPWCFLESTVL